MPEKNMPSDLFIAIVSSLWVGLAGVAGALVRQVKGPQKTWPQRIMEWLADCCLTHDIPALLQYRVSNNKRDGRFCSKAGISGIKREFAGIHRKTRA